MITVILSRMSQCFTVFFPKTNRSCGSSQANRMMKRFHLTIPYIVACFIAYYGFFRYYPQLKTSFLGICILCYAAAYFIRLVFGATICPVPFAAPDILSLRVGCVSLFHPVWAGR